MTQHIYQLRNGLTPSDYDCIDAMVIIASSADRARILAGQRAADEGPKIWLSTATTVKRLGPYQGLEYSDEVIQVSFNAG